MSSKNYEKTKYLLDNYRTVKWSVTIGMEQLQRTTTNMCSNIDEQDVNIISIDKFIQNAEIAGINLDNVELKHQIKVIEKNQFYLNCIDRALNLIKLGHHNGNVYYYILYYAYISLRSVQFGAQDIITELHEQGIDIGKSQYFKYRDEAISLVSDIIWGYSSDIVSCLDEFTNNR